jgi:hypothetical protein
MSLMARLSWLYLKGYRYRMDSTNRFTPTESNRSCTGHTSGSLRIEGVGGAREAPIHRILQHS